VLAALALGLGVLGVTDVPERLVNATSSDPHAHVHISLVSLHGWPLLLSAITVGLGLLLYRARPSIPAPELPDMRQVWDGALGRVYRFAELYSTRWQNGSTRWYLSVTLAFVAGLLLVGLDRSGIVLGTVPVTMSDTPWYGMAIAALAAVATVAVARAATRLAAALALTAVGLLVSLIFVVYRSPDILLTQILIETVSTIFILLILIHMPGWRPEKASPGRRLVDLAVAGAVGMTMMIFVPLMTSPSLRAKTNLAGDYLERTFSEGGGHNAVNVIIVDFRAIDTTGEIVVLTVVGLIVFGLLRSRRKAAS
jgi:multisubunit Na+/H+ antiporter MnhB subunit